MRSEHKFIIFSLVKTGQAGSKVTYDWNIDHKAEANKDASSNKELYNTMLGMLPSDEARFVVFDFIHVRDDGREIQKLVLIKWYLNSNNSVFCLT